MTDTTKTRAVEAMAEAIRENPTACSREAATAALAALHRFATDESARLWVPVEAQAEQRRAMKHSVRNYNKNQPKGEYAAPDAVPLIHYAAGVAAATDPLAPEPGA